ncbi:protein-L-isoaspartate O-methyltransferase [Marinicauda salina]|uniref:Protein-L-isoaspartate O-methyltransferase n=1 Tax=Marinicauda salina TaxID=2135793 RepID=A0A2U2BT04_9PROT|nr:protein-L-isoaspartate O-methyltransferase [Marinicauda salina]PWE17134.1 protein-L-isoaspartate O-methyltransferase [Marinicauda salina]
MSDFANARAAMVNSQVRVADVTDHRIQDAMSEIPRERFVPRSKAAQAYADAEVECAPGRVMLRPRDLAKLIQAVDVGPDELVLDIACGRGYSTAVLARLAETVVGLESEEALVKRASERLPDVGADNAVVVRGDLKAGVPDQGPFDVIFVGGAVEDVPDAWFDQLADGGRLAVIVREGPVGKATVFTRSGSAIGDRVHFDAAPPVMPGFEREAGFVF